MPPSLSTPTISNLRRRGEVERAQFEGGWLVQATSASTTGVRKVHQARVIVTDRRIRAVTPTLEWSWLLHEIEEVRTASDASWAILRVGDIRDHGIAVRPEDVERFRELLETSLPPGPNRANRAPAPVPAPVQVPTEPVADRPAPVDAPSPAPPLPPASLPTPEPVLLPPPADDPPASVAAAPPPPPAAALPEPAPEEGLVAARGAAVEGAVLAALEARSITAWFGERKVLDRVSLTMPAGSVTALIGPSGCGKSTFLRILNRMHELVPSARLAGEVLLDGTDVYDSARKLTDARREIGMVFQKPNPFPAMSIYDNVIAGLRLTGTRATAAEKDALVEACLTKGGLWNEVKDRLRQPGGSLSGGQQQRLCIARALAIRPRVLLMDEPCSALDPTSTRRIEQTIEELATEVTIVIVTHNMQQAARVSHRCAFFLAEHGTPGVIVEHGPTEEMFSAPQDPRTDDYVNGRFG